jgi:hypothetical protein
MARIPSSAAALALTVLAGAAAAEHQEPAKSIAVPSIAAATLGSTGSVSGPAVSGDVNTDIAETTLSADVKVAFPLNLSVELGVQTAQPTAVANGTSGAVFDNGDTIPSGAQVTLAITYANYDLLPDNDPNVQKFEAALHNCQAVSSSRLREKGREMDALRERQKKNALQEGDQEKLAAREQSGCTYGETDAFWLAERARSRPFIVSVKGLMGRSATTFFDPATLAPQSDLLSAGASIAVGQYVTSGLIVAGSFRWAYGNVASGAVANICHQVGTDALNQPITQCDTGVLGTPVPGNHFRLALELRHMVGNGLIWVPSVSLSWADLNAPTVRAQMPLLFELVSNHEGQTPLLVGLTFGYSQLLGPQLRQSFTIAGTLQTELSLGQLL